MASAFVHLPNVISADHLLPELTEDQLRQIVLKFDFDNNKKLSKKELTAAFAYLGSIVPGIRAWLGMITADANGDGEIDFEKELDKLLKYIRELRFKASAELQNNFKTTSK